jgi:hypothetical protein
MDSTKRYALYALVGFAAGLILGYCLHTCPETIRHAEFHASESNDSLVQHVNIREVDVTPPLAMLPAHSLPIKYSPARENLDTAHAYVNWPDKPYIELPFFAIATDSEGYSEVSIDTSKGLSVRHSKRFVSVSDTSTYAARYRSKSDSSVTVLEASRNPLSLTAYILTPVFQAGHFAVSPFETKAACLLALDLGIHWQAVVQPEFYPVRVISDARNALVVNAGIGYTF